MAGAPNILMLCNNFRKDAASPYLTNSLADALVAEGASVRVGVIDWQAPFGKPELVTMPSGVEALFVAPRAVRGLGRFVADATKWLGASYFLKRALRRAFSDRKIDLMIAFSPLVTTGFPIRWAKRQFGCEGFAYITDFFPLHQHAAGQIPGGAPVKVGLAIENNLMARFETIACMSPAGVAYLRNHYKLTPAQQTPVLRLWGETDPLPAIDRAAVRSGHGLPTDRPIILFGGQISEGRAIEDVLAIARMAQQRRPDLLFLLLGNGRLEPLVRAYIADGGDNLILHPGVTRHAYLEIASACDVGLVATIAGTGVPTFPSKTIDYLRAGLPIAASTETSSDYGPFVRENGFGTSVAAGENEAWLADIIKLVDAHNLRQTMIEAGRRTLVEHFDVAVAARTILTAIAHADPAER